MNFNTELEISNKASSEENTYLKNRILSLEKAKKIASIKIITEAEFIELINSNSKS